MNIKTPPNTASIKNLKEQNFKVTIRHYRKKLWRDEREPLILDKSIRENIKRGGFGYEMVSQKGGATELELFKDGETIVVRADCYHKDAFSKRVGTKVCIDRLKNLYNINA